MLGIDPDYLLHSQRLSAAIQAYAGNGREEFRTFCLTCFRDAITQYPLDYAKKVLGQFSLFSSQILGTFSEIT